MTAPGLLFGGPADAPPTIAVAQRRKDAL